jgi:hypothetical protein
MRDHTLSVGGLSARHERRAGCVAEFPYVALPFVPRLLVNSRVAYLAVPPDEVFTAYWRHCGSLQLRIGAYGLEHDGGDRVVGVWVYETEDGGSVLVESRWGSDGTDSAWVEDVPVQHHLFEKVIGELDGKRISFVRNAAVPIEVARDAWLKEVVERVGQSGKLATARR